MLKECLNYSLEIWVVTQGHKEKFMEKGEIKNDTPFETIQKEHSYYKDKALTQAMIC